LKCEEAVKTKTNSKKSTELFYPALLFGLDLLFWYSLSHLSYEILEPPVEDRGF
jgi:hypothetical protein